MLSPAKLCAVLTLFPGLQGARPSSCPMSSSARLATSLDGDPERHFKLEKLRLVISISRLIGVQDTV
jgi:hypothetical protein